MGLKLNGRLLKVIMPLWNECLTTFKGENRVKIDQMAGVESENLLRRLQAVSPVSVAAYSDSPAVFATIRRVLMRAGYPTESMGLHHMGQPQ